MSARQNMDDLYAEIILTLSDQQIVGLPDGIAMAELARRFPEVYERCTKVITARIRSREVPYYIPVYLDIKTSDLADKTKMTEYLHAMYIKHENLNTLNPDPEAYYLVAIDFSRSDVTQARIQIKRVSDLSALLLGMSNIRQLPQQFVRAWAEQRKAKNDV